MKLNSNLKQKNSSYTWMDVSPGCSLLAGTRRNFHWLSSSWCPPISFSKYKEIPPRQNLPGIRRRSQYGVRCDRFRPPRGQGLCSRTPGYSGRTCWKKRKIWKFKFNLFVSWFKSKFVSGENSWSCDWSTEINMFIYFGGVIKRKILVQAII